MVEKEIQTCEVCCEEKYLLTASICDHKYCKSCLKQIIQTQICKRKSIITCPGLDCKEKIRFEVFRKVFDLKIQKANMQHFKWLICKTCSNFVMAFPEQPGEVQMQCQKCGSIHSSRYKSLWNDCLTQEEIDEMIKYRELGFMRCSQCYAWVERIDGCDHMVCRCEYEFCFKCGAYREEEDLFDSDDYHTCDKRSIYGAWFARINQ